MIAAPTTAATAPPKLSPPILFSLPDVPVAALGAVVVAIIPLVNGATAALVAPSKAIGCEVAVGFVTADVLEGLRTLSIMCMTPLETMMSAPMTSALLAKILESSEVTVRDWPMSDGKDSLASPLESRVE